MKADHVVCSQCREVSPKSALKTTIVNKRKFTVCPHCNTLCPDYAVQRERHRLKTLRLKTLVLVSLWCYLLAVFANRPFLEKLAEFPPIRSFLDSGEKSTTQPEELSSADKTDEKKNSAPARTWRVPEKARIRITDVFLEGYYGSDSPAVLLVPAHAATNLLITRINDVTGFGYDLDHDDDLYPPVTVLLVPPRPTFIESKIRLSPGFSLEKLKSHETRDRRSKRADFYTHRSRHQSFQWDPNEFYRFNHEYEHSCFHLEPNRVYVVSADVRIPDDIDTGAGKRYSSILLQWNTRIETVDAQSSFHPYLEMIEKQRLRFAENRTEDDFILSHFIASQHPGIRAVNKIINYADFSEPSSPAPENRTCQNCGYRMDHELEYCIQCGTKQLKWTGYDLFLREIRKKREHYFTHEQAVSRLHIERGNPGIKILLNEQPLSVDTTSIPVKKEGRYFIKVVYPNRNVFFKKIVFEPEKTYYLYTAEKMLHRKKTGPAGIELTLIDKDRIPGGNDGPEHLYFGCHEITNAQFEQFMPEHRQYRDKHSPGDRHPAIMVSWKEAALFCNWLSRQENLIPFYDAQFRRNVHSYGYRLPTAGEWLALAGDPPQPDDIPANLRGDENFEFTAPVDAFPANAHGICGMFGNVSELCHDWYTTAFESGGYYGPNDGKSKAVMGGNWNSPRSPREVLSRDFKFSHDRSYYMGFRVCRNVPSYESSLKTVPIDHRRYVELLEAGVPHETIIDTLDLLRESTIEAGFRNYVLDAVVKTFFRWRLPSLENYFSYLEDLYSRNKAKTVFLVKNILPRISLPGEEKQRYREIIEYAWHTDFETIGDFMNLWFALGDSFREIRQRIESIPDARVEKEHFLNLFTRAVVAISRKKPPDRETVETLFRKNRDSAARWIGLGIVPALVEHADFASLDQIVPFVDAFDRILPPDFPDRNRINLHYAHAIAPFLLDNDCTPEQTLELLKALTRKIRERGSLRILFDFKKLVSGLSRGSGGMDRIKQCIAEYDRDKHLELAKLNTPLKGAFYENVQKTACREFVEEPEKQKSNAVEDWIQLDLITDIRKSSATDFDSLKYRGELKSGVIEKENDRLITMRIPQRDSYSGKIIGYSIEQYERHSVSEINRVFDEQERKRYLRITDPGYSVRKFLEENIEISGSKDGPRFCRTSNVRLYGIDDDIFAREAVFLCEQILRGYDLAFRTGFANLETGFRARLFSRHKDYMRFTEKLIGRASLHPAYFIPRINLTCVYNPNSRYENYSRTFFNRIEKRLDEQLEELDNLRVHNIHKTRYYNIINSRKRRLRARRKSFEYLMEKEKRNIFKSLFHEGFHFFMHNVIARGYGIETCPLWLNEGFAQFYEFSEIQNNELLIGGVHEPAVDFILSFLLDDRWVDIENLLNANSDLFTVSTHSKSEYLESYTYYLFSWALVYYLTDRYDLTLPNAAPSPPPSGPIPPSDVPMMKRYLHDVKNGLSNTEAFENMIGTSIYLFESEWKKYFRNKIFKLMKT